MNLIANRSIFERIAVTKEKIQLINPMGVSLPIPIITSNIVINRIIIENIEKCLLIDEKFIN